MISFHSFARAAWAGIVLSGALALPAYAQPTTFAPVPFTDVAKTHPYYEAIEALRDGNVLRGYPDGTFHPERRITRAEFVRLIVNPFFLDTQRMHDCIPQKTGPDSPTIFFPDVARTAWYAEEVCFAKTANIIDGYADGRFYPLHAITAAEAAKIVASVFALSTDRDPTDPLWYKPYLQKLAALHALPVSIRSVSQPLNRGEMAEMVWRVRMDKTTKASATYESLRK